MPNLASIVKVPLELTSLEHTLPRCIGPCGCHCVYGNGDSFLRNVCAALGHDALAHLGQVGTWAVMTVEPCQRQISSGERGFRFS
jgi:hypothetical protein